MPEAASNGKFQHTGGPGGDLILIKDHHHGTVLLEIEVLLLLQQRLQVYIVKEQGLLLLVPLGQLLFHGCRTLGGPIGTQNIPQGQTLAGLQVQVVEVLPEVGAGQTLRLSDHKGGPLIRDRLYLIVHLDLDGLEGVRVSSRIQIGLVVLPGPLLALIHLPAEYCADLQIYPLLQAAVSGVFDLGQLDLHVAGLLPALIGLPGKDPAQLAQYRHIVHRRSHRRGGEHHKAGAQSGRGRSRPLQSPAGQPGPAACLDGVLHRSLQFRWGGNIPVGLTALFHGMGKTVLFFCHIIPPASSPAISSAPCTGGFSPC